MPATPIPGQENHAVQAMPVLATKLFMPPPRPGLVGRARLLSRLDQGQRAAQRLSLVCAPAGYGKTTLVAEWMSNMQPAAMAGTAPTPAPGSSFPASTAWLSIDAEDNDPIRFVTHLVAALQTNRGPLHLLSGPQLPPAEVVAAVIVNDLAARSYPIILALDDYHKIQNLYNHDLVHYLVEHQPPQLHLALITREDPPLPLARLRARGQLTEIREHDLRFTTAEAADFLNRATGLALQPEWIATLAARTEGWIAGLQLAALSLQGRTDVASFIKEFSGSHRYVMDYLLEEVFNQQSGEIQTFLLQTSILDRLCGPLCEAVLGDEEHAAGSAEQRGTDARAILAQIEHTHLFLIPLDDRGQWYRYHHLFAELLRARLSNTQPRMSTESVAALHTRAAMWFEQAGLVPEAIRHTLQAGDHERAARLIEHNTIELMTRGELATLLNWISALPPQLARQKPLLCVQQAWAFAFGGQIDKVEPLLQLAEQGIEHAGASDPSHGYILGTVATMRSFVAYILNDWDTAMQTARQADMLLPQDDTMARSLAAYIVGRIHRGEGDFARAEHALMEAVRIARGSGNIWNIAGGVGELALLRKMQGRLREAIALYGDVEQLAEEYGVRQYITASKIDVGLADLLLERNELAIATNLVTATIEQFGHWGNPIELLNARLVLARIQLADGNLAGAEASLTDVEAIRRRQPIFPLLSKQIDVTRVRLWLAQGDITTAVHWATAHPPETVLALTGREMDAIARIRVLLAQRQPDEALHPLREWTSSAESGARIWALIELLVLQAVACHATGHTEQALDALARALTLAQPEGFVRVFIDEGAPIAELLQMASQRSTSVAGDAARLLAAFPIELRNTAVVIPAATMPLTQNLVEPLSDRELEVLRLLADGMGNQAIAQKLFVAGGTVKAHVAAIYRKLDVHSRTQAVARARELGLL